MSQYKILWEVWWCHVNSFAESNAALHIQPLYFLPALCFFSDLVWITNDPFLGGSTAPLLVSNGVSLSLFVSVFDTVDKGGSFVFLTERVHCFGFWLTVLCAFMVRFHCPTPIPIPIPIKWTKAPLVQIPMVIPMVIPMDNYYENYLNSTLLVLISVPNWVQ